MDNVKELDAKTGRIFFNIQSLATSCQLQTEGSTYRRAESDIRKKIETIKRILNNAWWQPQGTGIWKQPE